MASGSDGADRDESPAGDRLVRVLAALSTDGAGPLPGRLCHAAVVLLGVDGASVSLLSGGRYRATVCASDELAAQLEEVHLTLGEGPGLDADRAGRPVFEADLAGTSPARWPAFTGSAVEAGAAAVFAFPMRIGAIRVGVLGLHRTVPGPLTSSGVGDALLLARLGAQAVLAAAADVPADELAADPSGGGMWAEVHQATGMISVQLGVGMEEAFVRLQAHAYATGRLIGEVGCEVVGRRLRFDPD